MTVQRPSAVDGKRIERDIDSFDVDVAVLGGGPAGVWAALSAAETGAQVALVDKGYIGTSGATAAGNTTIIHTLPDTAERAAAVERRLKRGYGLADRGIVERVLQETHLQLLRLAEWGYPFPRREDGSLYLGSMRGADYLHFMRRRLLKAGVRLFDHTPALNLVIEHGTITGVACHSHATRTPLHVRTGAVVIATGGCTFRSGALGTHNLTGDGCLMGAEAGAMLSGMELTGQYGISARHAGVTKGIIYFWASFFDADGRRIEDTGDRQEIVARHLMRGPVTAVIDRAPARLREGIRVGQPNIMLPFDRIGVDPFTERFPVTLRYEGTVRGIGGLLIDDHGATGVRGLFAAGDAAARETIAGAVSGGGGPNASWALATGVWSGRAAASFARGAGGKPRRPPRATNIGGASRRSPFTASEVIAAVQTEILPLDRSFVRTAKALHQSRETLERLWSDTHEALAADASDPLAAREALAMLATARWMVASAEIRTETRGICRRLDHPGPDPSQGRRVIAGGLDRVFAGFEPALSKAVGQ
jgi:succinate dehydrogenase/fumarate reductase flavoprotein subunit